MDVGAAFVAGAEPAEVVQVREPALDDPPPSSEARAVGGAAAGDDRSDPARPEQPAVLVVVIAAVSEHDIGLLPRPPWFASDWPSVQEVQQREELGDVVAVAAGQRDSERNAGAIDQQVVL